MYSTDSIDRVKAYILEHIDEYITAEELAVVSGYSFYHFCHLFAGITGQSVAAYLRHLRLELASNDILCGESITEVAKRRGFDTASGFSKAFKKRYGMSPREYKATKGGHSQICPEIRRMDTFLAVGYCFAPPEGEFNVLDMGAYWSGNDFSFVSKADYARLNSAGLGEIGMWMRPDKVSGEYYYFFGPIVADANYIPKGMEALEIPAAEYAIFPVEKGLTRDMLKTNIRLTWSYIFEEWLEESDYDYDEGRFDFEYYAVKKVFVCIPVKKKRK